MPPRTCDAFGGKTELFIPKTSARSTTPCRAACEFARAIRDSDLPRTAALLPLAGVFAWAAGRLRHAEDVEERKRLVGVEDLGFGQEPLLEIHSLRWRPGAS